MTLLNLIRRPRLAVDLGSENIRLVEAYLAGSSLRCLGARTLDSDQLVNKNYFLNIIFKEKLRFKKLSLGLNSSNFKNEFLSLASLGEGELDQIVKNKYRQAGSGHSIIQYLSYEDREAARTNCLVSEFEASRLDSIRSFISSIFLRPDKLNINNKNIVNLINFGQPVNKNYSIENKNILVLDLGSLELDITIFRNTNISYMNRFENKLASLLKAEGVDYGEFMDFLRGLENIYNIEGSPGWKKLVYGYLDSIVELLRLNLSFYSREYGERISFIILTGGFSDLPGIDNYITSRLNKQSLVLRELKNIEGDVKLNLYGNALGSLILKKEARNV